MNPIIDPMWFYWMKVADDTREICVVVAVLMLVAMILLVILMATGIEDYSETEKTKFTKWVIAMGIILVVSLVGCIFIPSKETLIEMQIAKFTTYDNAQWTIDSIKGIVDYVIEAVKNTK